MFAVIALVGEENARSWPMGLHHDVIALVVGDFAAGDRRGYGQAFGVGAKVYLGREATFRAPKTLFLSPPLAPAA